MLSIRTSRYLAMAMLLMGLLLTACGTLPGAIQPPETPATQVPLPETAEPEPGPVVGGLRPIDVAAVNVEIGQGSPIPVDVLASGSWPDLCAQLVEIEQAHDGARFEVHLSAAPANPACPPDFVGLPFRIAIPLNMVELAPGTYTVVVNGVETRFDWQGAGEVPAGAARPAGDLQPIPVSALTVEIGIGSPIPVEAVVSGSWPELCAQLAQVEQRVSGSRIEIRLLATPADPGCPPDQVGLPFRMALPLNMVELPPGEYSVVVNGLETSFAWPATAPEPVDTGSLPAVTIAYTGPDGNIWVLATTQGGPRQITMDAAQEPSGETVNYYFPRLSSDGALVAFRRDQGRPVASGLEFSFGLWVHDLNTGESRQIYDRLPAGFSWEPGTHRLAFGQSVSDGYFTARGDIDPSLAGGIMELDWDTGQTGELVKPERGFTLNGPSWSPDGRYLSFEEIINYEGSGMFAYFDIEAEKYVAWEEALGLYDWSPDSRTIAFDRLTYAATGEERIFLKDLLAGEPQQLSPESLAGYAFSPEFSPAGDRLAYFANPGGPDSQLFILYVQNLSGGEPVELGQFESANSLAWSPDGSYLVFSAGPYENQEVIAVDVTSGTATMLASGTNVTLAGPG